jgi:hypothetical protein
LIITASPALTGLTQQGIVPASGQVVIWIFLTFEFAGMALVSLVGLLMLRSAWRRAHAQLTIDPRQGFLYPT